jgi:hypothetical protein
MKRSLRHVVTKKGERVQVALGADRDGYSVIVIDNATGKPVQTFGAAHDTSPLFRRATLDVDGDTPARRIAKRTDDQAFPESQAIERASKGGTASTRSRQARNAARDRLILQLHEAGKTAQQIVDKLTKEKHLKRDGSEWSVRAVLAVIAKAAAAA